MMDIVNRFLLTSYSCTASLFIARERNKKKDFPVEVAAMLITDEQDEDSD